MKRLAVVVLVVTALAGVALATWGGAASAREAGPASPGRRSSRRCPRTSRSAGASTSAIKCDSPPFGYIDVRGQNAGFDVEIARWFSRFAFGKSNRVTLHVRDHAGPRARAHDGPRRHGDRDVHVHGRPRHADRLLACVLQGDGAHPRAEQRTEQLPADDSPERRSRRRAARSTTAG